MSDTSLLIDSNAVNYGAGFSTACNIRTRLYARTAEGASAGGSKPNKLLSEKTFEIGESSKLTVSFSI
jgi:hypothetical protein